MIVDDGRGIRGRGIGIRGHARARRGRHAGRARVGGGRLGLSLGLRLGWARRVAIHARHHHRQLRRVIHRPQSRAYGAQEQQQQHQQRRPGTLPDRQVLDLGIGHAAFERGKNARRLRLIHGG
ncbi:hypothetical protein NAT65_12000 [Achromobacter xylosoxidans]|uniref:hypothetical protein n=1 Tax=Alcaligenes xylosoxydans xylosoxydans TaxID=85698 RepID=UPI00203CEA60|nr:hypothetical protein [Achromobacter xylosoxidans]MCM2571802.1 hypothetical protein [Achromobacter xylosoxidans]